MAPWNAPGWLHVIHTLLLPVNTLAIPIVPVAFSIGLSSRNVRRRVLSRGVCDGSV